MRIEQAGLGTLWQLSPGSLDALQPSALPVEVSDFFNQPLEQIHFSNNRILLPDFTAIILLRGHLRYFRFAEKIVA